jgi:hypothetical protein
MFHAAENVTLEEVSWQNNRADAVLVAWGIDEEAIGDATVSGLETTEPFEINLPDTRIDFTFTPVTKPISPSLPVLQVEWIMVDEVNQFVLRDECTTWTRTNQTFTENDGQGEVYFNIQEEGIVIVGVLDIGGDGHGPRG